MAPGSEVVGQDSLQRLPGGAERAHCWASYPLLLPSLARWSAWLQGSVGASVGGPCSKLAEGVVDSVGGAAADGGRCLSDG